MTFPLLYLIFIFLLQDFPLTLCLLVLLIFVIHCNDVILLADSTRFHNHIFVQALRQAIDFNQLHCVM